MQLKKENKNLLLSKSDIFSQNGEDGIIAELFDRIDGNSKICCEFGAWDGIHLSNCRNLILNGWTAVMIEGEIKRFQDLTANYRDNPSVICVNKFVDSGHNSLASILKDNGISQIDFLSIDIDGLDYEIFETLDVKPKIICIEVNAGHNPENNVRIEREIAKNNVGQSLMIFTEIGESKGYDLICYNGNAFFLRKDIVENSGLKVLSVKEAYQNFLNDLSTKAKEWLYLVNLGKVGPRYRFNNNLLSKESLGIGTWRSLALKLSKGRI